MPLFKNDEAKNYYQKKSNTFYDGINALVEDEGISIKDIAENPFGYTRRMSMSKYFALFDLVNKIIQIPGSIADFGVYKGGSTFFFMHFLETFFPCERSRMVYGFDNFNGYLQNYLTDKDKEKLRGTLRGQTLEDGSRTLISSLLDYHDQDSFLPGVPRLELVDGDIIDTLPQFIEQNPAIRFALINCDVNLYEPVKVILEYAYPKLMPGGVMMFSGYPNEPWDGEAKAIENFFDMASKPVRFHSFQYSPYPRSYLIKE